MNLIVKCYILHTRMSLKWPLVKRKCWWTCYTSSVLLENSITRPALNLLYTSINQSGQTRYLCRFRLDFSAGLHLIFEVESAFCESSVFSVVPHVCKQSCVLVILFELLIIMTATIRSRLNYSSFPLPTVILILENVSQYRIELW